MVANSSPRYDLHLMNAIGASVTCSNGFVYAFNILIQMGALPQVTYFESPRRDTFDSLEAGVADFSRMLEHGNEDKIDRLRDYIAHHMIENPHAGEPGSKGVPQGRYMLDHIRKVRWAFIAWEPVSAPRSQPIYSLHRPPTRHPHSLRTGQTRSTPRRSCAIVGQFT